MQSEVLEGFVFNLLGGGGAGNSSSDGSTTSGGGNSGNGTSTSGGNSDSSIPAPSGLSYTGSPFIFTLNVAVGTITPTVTGTITSCTASPLLPNGLSIDNTTCAISGTPMAAQLQTGYIITASNSNGSSIANIVIAIGGSFTLSWGTFVDKMNGTISFVGTGTYAGQSLIFMKCSQDKFGIQPLMIVLMVLLYSFNTAQQLVRLVTMVTN